MTTPLTIYYVPEATAENKAKPGHSLNPCRSCGATCCTQPVPFSVAEALRMSHGLQRPIASFAEPSYSSRKIHNAWPFKLAGGSAHFEFLTPRYRCVHAGDPVDGQLRCGVWSMRPNACRVYPFSVEYAGEQFFVGDENWCPEHWLQDDDLRASVSAAIAQWRIDLTLDKRLMSTWNRGRRKDRSLDAFYRYLYDVVAPQLGFDCSAFISSPP